MIRHRPPLTLENIRDAHAARRDEIRSRLNEFEQKILNGTDRDVWEEMVFCFFTAGCSARMGLRSIDAVRPLLINGSQRRLARALTGVHRYPNARSRYIVASRDFLERDCGLRIRERLLSFDCPFERRDWLVKEKGIKGLGYKEASHFLRNIGFRGYAILDKHVLRCLAELGLIATDDPPKNRARYLEVEDILKRFSGNLGIDPDEMDLVLWSLKTGEILK